MSRYYITAEYRSSCLKQLREISRSSNKTGRLGHSDLSKARISKDEESVQLLVDLMSETWTNPFSSDPFELISISTGASAPPEISVDLLAAQDKCHAASVQFLSERLDKAQKTFFDRLPRLKLKIVDNLNKNVTKNVSNKEQVLRSDNRLFGQMLLVASSRKMNMKDILQHPLGPLPWSLANCDGSMKKTNKAVLARKLESMAAPAEVIPQPSACIIDAMSLIQKINGENLTFVEVSDNLLTTVLKLCGECDECE